MLHLHSILTASTFETISTTVQEPTYCHRLHYVLVNLSQTCEIQYVNIHINGFDHLRI